MERIVAHVVMDHPPTWLWKVLGHPELYPRFIRGFTWCERVWQGDRGTQGARYLITFRTDDGTIFQDEVQIATYRPGEHLAWASVRDPECRMSVRLRPFGDGRTQLSVLLTLPSSPHTPNDAGAQRRLDEVAHLINDHVAGMPATASKWAPDARSVRKTRLGQFRVLLRAGIIGPLWRPFRALRQLGLISRWGPSLAGVFQSAAARDPGRTAVVDERGSLTYTELDELSSRLANGMAGLDIRAGDRVMMLCRNHSTMLATMIAASKIGADLVLLNSHLTGPMLIQAVREHRPAALFSDDEFATVAKVVPGDVLRISTWREHGHRGITVDQLIKDAEPGRPRRPRHPGRIILQTAGTTGPPRSYYRTLPRGRGLGTASVVLSAIPHRVHDHMLLTTPLFHVWGFNAMQLGMALRGTLVLRRGHEPETLLADVDKHKCDTVYVRHDLLQRMLDLPADVRARYDISAIRIIVSAGSVPGPMARRVMSKFGDILYHIYGASEVTWGTIARPEDLRVAPATAGVPPPGTRIAILDSSGDPVPPGSIGRIFVGNEMVFSGYTDGSMPDTFDKLLDTGDHGYLDANGRLFVAGRDGEQIVSRGEIFYTRAVEEVIAALPQVEQVAVVGLSSTEYTQRLAAHVVLRPGAQLEVEALWHHVHERLGRAAVPRDVYFVDRLPVTSTGTVMKRMLRTGMFPVQGGQAHLPRP